MKRKSNFLSVIFLVTISFSGFSQSDTTYRVDIENINRGSSKLDREGNRWFQRNPYKALIVPAALIGVGAVLIQNPVYDRFDFHEDLFQTFPGFKGTNIDDYLVYTPYVGLAALNLAKIKCENDFINTTLLIFKAEIINLTLTFGLKRLVGIERPNKKNFQSWPSGHTSEAFLAAAMINREFRHRSPWIGVAAYGVATSVGAFRMLNNAHWLSDVVAGAGFGILSANLAYLTHQWRFGRPGSCFVPFYSNGSAGMLMAYRF